MHDPRCVSSVHSSEREFGGRVGKGSDASVKLGPFLDGSPELLTPPGGGPDHRAQTRKIRIGLVQCT
eukprot:1284241-Lingulodinium_polyedra.AAC.1